MASACVMPHCSRHLAFIILTTALLATTAFATPRSKLRALAEWPDQFKPTVPSPFRRYFALPEDADSILKSLAGQGMFPPKSFVLEKPPLPATTPTAPPPRVVTPVPYYSAPVVIPSPPPALEETGNHFVELMERSLEALLTGGDGEDNTVRGNQLPNWYEEDLLLEHRVDQTKRRKAKKTSKKQKLTAEDLLNGTLIADDEIEGSGWDSSEHPSSIEGIPTVQPNIPKVPLDFQEALIKRQLESKRQWESAIPRLFFPRRPEVPEGGFGPLIYSSKTRRGEIRRHPARGMPLSARTAKAYDYGEKPIYQQGLMNSVLDFLGLPTHPMAGQPSELDRTLTEWLLQHAPGSEHWQKGRSRLEKLLRPHSLSESGGGGKSNSWLERFITQATQPLCPTPTPPTLPTFNVRAFMGQWYEVMRSGGGPDVVSRQNMCHTVHYRMLTESGMPYGVGSVFQTVEYATPMAGLYFPSGYDELRPVFTSGYGVVSSAGKMIHRMSTWTEDTLVHVIHADLEGLRNSGQYQYAILSVNCNYPIYVLARDPAVFRQKYEAVVNLVLRRKGLVNEVSRFLNVLEPVDFSQCAMPRKLFD